MSLYDDLRKGEQKMDMPFYDEDRAIFFDEPYPNPLMITDTLPLKDANLPDTTDVLVANINDKIIVIPTLSMVYHKVAQGTLDDAPYMMTFCVLCNFGGVFSPVVDDATHHFGCYGFHQGMAMLSDTETFSRWNHITGQCLNGEKAGYELTRLSNLTHTSLGKVLEMHPEALVVNPAFTQEESEVAHRWNDNYRSESPSWSEGLLGTITTLDTRLPRFDMGIGLWSDTGARYYSILTINATNNAVVDTFDGRTVVVYYDEETGFPSAFYADTATAHWTPHGIRLDGGAIYMNGILRDGTTTTTPERPRFQVIRWYGFAYLFPDCEIYGQSA